MNARCTVLVLLALTLAMGHAYGQARVYQWKDENGQMHFSDQPPPTRSGVEERTVFAAPPDATLPFTLRQVSSNFPVTLYSSDNCGQWCERARALLQSRGIPFSEKSLNTQEDLDAFSALFGGEPRVPAATVGSQQLKGFTESSWHALLDQVGYPREPLPGQ